MSLWTRIKNFFLDDRSIKEEFKAMIEADEIQKRVEVVKTTAAAVEKEIETTVDAIEAQVVYTTAAKVNDQITDAVTQNKPKRTRKPKTEAAPKKTSKKK